MPFWILLGCATPPDEVVAAWPPEGPAVLLAQAVSEPQQALLEDMLAPGRWEGPHGSMVLEGGVATLTLEPPCSVTVDGQGQVIVGRRCEALEVSGPWELGHHRLKVSHSGVTQEFGAYVDGEGRLHLGLVNFNVTGVGVMSGSEGLYGISGMHALVVRGDDCAMDSSLAGVYERVGCRWDQRGSSRLLMLDGHAKFKGVAGYEQQLLLLPEQGLLVHPLLVPMAFERR